MMLDEGYGQGDAKLRLGQLHDALLRNARFMAQGYPPIRLVRRALLGDDSRAL